MKVEVLFFGELRELAPRHLIALMEGNTLTDLIESLGRQFGLDLGQKVSDERLRILINGREHDFLGGMEAQLKEGDLVVFLPVVAGG